MRFLIYRQILPKRPPYSAIVVWGLTNDVIDLDEDAPGWCGIPSCDQVT
jgi:hypothetical protein